MSFGGEGLIGGEITVEVARPVAEGRGFIPKRFEMGGRLGIEDSAAIRTTVFSTCVLCRGIIINEPRNDEHPLPQWLHRYAGNSGDSPAGAFKIGKTTAPTWRQLCLASHQSCNSTFASKLENPVIKPFKHVVEGGRVTWSDLDLIFDWLDKVKASAALMGAAVDGHRTILGYDEISFPNKRIGVFDRIAIFFRVTDLQPSLDLWDCLHPAFLTTPSAICLQVKDLIVIYVSGNYLLSDAFGLGIGKLVAGEAEFVKGTGLFSNGFPGRQVRIPGAKIVAQPMRRQHIKDGLNEPSSALQKNGDGKIYELLSGRWRKVTQTSFSSLPKLNSMVGKALSALELTEWLILAKESDFSLYGRENSFFMESMPILRDSQRALLGLVNSLDPALVSG